MTFGRVTFLLWACVFVLSIACGVMLHTDTIMQAFRYKVETVRK